ncbi:MAG: MotA/TolQ/ExbB proton channel family protein [Kiritimatiellia bacterium]
MNMVLPPAGIGFALAQSNLAGKIIVALLFAGSIFAWSLMVSKIRELREVKRWSDGFVKAFRQEAHPASLYLKRRRYDPSPLYLIYSRSCAFLGSALEAAGNPPDDLFMGELGRETQRKIGRIEINGIRNIAERTMADQVLLLENHMGLLATATTTAPFLGLLGTVWGVMDAFGGMAFTANPMLSEVAPGISGALLTTVVGLLVALPSAIGYNMLSDRIRRFCVEMDNFVQELMSELERQYLRQD